MALALTLALAPTINCDRGAPPPPPPPPPAPPDIRLSPSPQRAIYCAGRELDVVTSFVAPGTDVESPPAADATVEYTITPPDAATLTTTPSGVRLRLAAAGQLTLRACVDDDAAAPRCAEAAIQVIDGAASLAVDSPLPGAELGGAGATTVEVHGSVDERCDVAVRVDDQPVAVDEQGRFSVEYTPQPGVNHITVVAGDAPDGQSRVEFDILWADDYMPGAVTATGAPSLRLDNAADLHLGPAFFDDGVPGDLSTSPVEIRDLADLLTLRMRALDLLAALPDPLLADPPTLILRALGARVGDVTVEVAAGAGAISVRFPSVEVDTEGSYSTPFGSIDLSGYVTIALNISFGLSIRKDDAVAPLLFERGDLTVAVESIEPHFVNGLANQYFDSVAGDLGPNMESHLYGSIESEIDQLLGDLHNGALDAIERVQREHRLRVGTGTFPAVNITLGAEVSAIERSPQDTLRTRLGVTLVADQPALHPASRGPARFDGAPPEMPPPASALRLVAPIEAANALLHLLWNSGLMEGDLTPALPEQARLFLGVDEILVSGRLPPILRRPRADEVGDLILAVGQIELELVDRGAVAKLDRRTRVGLAVHVGVDLAVVDNALHPRFTGDPSISVWPIHSNTTPALIGAGTLERTLEQLWPELRTALVDGLALALPIPAGDSAVVVPGFEGLQLHLRAPEQIDAHEGAFALDFGVTATLP
ncbi:hypothetical protein [Haliangium sp.]|uniref:hypothetical protein n=1 Tax=Haliangium sp. TaxID=2663208 RepID=UPI003D123CDF